ncbi:hypothetical protein COB55_05855 [Candidatus Wolfebacteria bacterium]|nr:MAG: hypothetical protein COB55_05855 [Candidatus Wolfebacteria bacterium]
MLITSENYYEEETKLFEENHVPIEFRARLSSMAYERGHSAGYDEVYGLLAELVCDLKKPIEEYKKRIKIEAVMQYIKI